MHLEWRGTHPDNSGICSGTTMQTGWRALRNIHISVEQIVLAISTRTADSCAAELVRPRHRAKRR